MPEVGCNMAEPVMEVHHSDLNRVGKNSMYRSRCPKCREGVLLVRRNLTTFQLAEYDQCIFCGQVFRYLDIDTLRAQETPR